MQTPANTNNNSKATSPAVSNTINTEPPASNSSSTSTTLAIDPYQNSRTHPANGSFRFALTPEECRAAEERLMAICGLETLQRYLGEFPGSLGGGEPFNTTARYWHSNIKTIEETRDRVLELDNKESRLNEARNIIDQEIALIKGDKAALEEFGRKAMRYVRHNMWQVKSAIKEAQRDLRKSDERDLREAARQDGRKLTILPPSDSNPDVRPLSNEEVGTRMTARCTKCGQFGHWWNDHYSIKCPHCALYAPGHSPNHCSQNPHQKSASNAAEDGSQASSRNDTGSMGWGVKKEGWALRNESGWGSWDSEKIDDAPWLEWKERALKERLEKKKVGNGWDPIENNTEAHWVSPTEAEKRRKERAARRQTRFLLTPGDRKAARATRLNPARRHRRNNDEKEEGEWSGEDWEDNFPDEAYGNMCDEPYGGF